MVSGASARCCHFLRMIFEVNATRTGIPGYCCSIFSRIFKRDFKAGSTVVPNMASTIASLWTTLYAPLPKLVVTPRTSREIAKKQTFNFITLSISFWPGHKKNRTNWHWFGNALFPTNDNAPHSMGQIDAGDVSWKFSDRSSDFRINLVLHLPNRYDQWRNAELVLGYSGEPVPESHRVPSWLKHLRNETIANDKGKQGGCQLAIPLEPSKMRFRMSEWTNGIGPSCQTLTSELMSKLYLSFFISTRYHINHGWYLGPTPFSCPPLALGTVLLFVILNANQGRGHDFSSNY